MVRSTRSYSADVDGWCDWRNLASSDTLDKRTSHEVPLTLLTLTGSRDTAKYTYRKIFLGVRQGCFFPKLRQDCWSAAVDIL